MYSLVALSLVLGATALSPRSCSFGLTASGGQSGTIGQLSDGQNRIGGGLAPATFTIDNGGITDAAGRGCILTEGVEQFQCDEGKGPTYGFAIESNGTLTSSGSSVFYACPASETEWNLYTTPVIGQLKCVEISLAASGCAASTSAAISVATVTVTVNNCAAPSQTVFSTSVQTPTYVKSVSSTPAEIQSSTIPVPQTTETSIAVAPTSVPYVISTDILPTQTIETYSSAVVTPSVVSPTPVTTYASSAPETTLQTVTQSTWSQIWSNATVVSTASSTAASSTCVPTVLSGSSTSGNYQYPHLIIPVNSSSPSTAYGTQYFGDISPSVSSLFNFDIPASYAGHTCSLVFLLPLQSQLETSAYDFSGNGAVDISQLSSTATQSTTYNTVPSVEADLGTFTLTEGSSTLVKSFACPAGEAVSYEISAVGDTDLYYFQDWNPSPLGLYVTYC